MSINNLCISYVRFVDIFTRSLDDFILMKFLIAVFLRAPPFIPTSLFINFGDFYQPLHFLHPPCLFLWPKFANLPVYFALPFYLTLQSMGKLIKKRSMMTISCLLTVNFKLACVSSLRKRIYWQSIPEPQGGRKEITF